MKTKVINIDDSIENITIGTFIYCKELKKGFVLKDNHKKLSEDLSFNNINIIIEILDYQTILDKGIDSIEFKNGIPYISQRVEERVKFSVEDLNDSIKYHSFIDDFKKRRRYFDDSKFTILLNSTTPDESEEDPSKSSTSNTQQLIF